MIQLSLTQAASLAGWFTPERPGPLVGAHVLRTGLGSAWVDCLPHPRAVLVEAAGNYSLAGAAGALGPGDLPPLAGFIEAPPAFVPVLRAALPALAAWERVIFELAGAPAAAREAVPVTGALVRRLGPADAPALDGLSDECHWVSKTWGGPAGLAASGHAWGAFVAGRLVSVAGTFFLGEAYEDVAVATEPGWRGCGLSPACAAALCADICARGRRPSWSTSADNPASQRVAQKLGFVPHRRDVLYLTDRSLV
jgi:GNAT superfamily N-acetyltransferase